MQKWYSLKKIFLILTGLLTLAIIGLIIWFKNLGQAVEENLKRGWFVPPIEFYSAPDEIHVDERLTRDEVSLQLIERGYIQADPDQRLTPGVFSIWPLGKCQAHVSQPLPLETNSCLVFRPKTKKQSPPVMIGFSDQPSISAVLSGEPFAITDKATLAPLLYAQYYGNKPVLRKVLSIGDVPLYCAQAVTAIEDKEFLNHQGFNPISFARAIIKNLSSGRYAQGGSTITQQLVKNYFLSSEKTIRRKLKEIAISFIVEAKFDKDTILENYLNVIYMGQNGPFEVRGFGAAAEHYLQKELRNLNLSECALLAALLNNPGRYNPFRHPEKAQERRQKVLDEMLELNMITKPNYDIAAKAPLPSSDHIKVRIEPAPFYVDAVFRELEKLGINVNNFERGLKVYTYLNIKAQRAAQNTVRQGLDAIEGQYKSFQDKVAEGKKLQGLLINTKVATGGIQALVGSRSYKLSQFNRALDSRRQVGSIMKPFVYLTALESLDTNGQTYTPLTLLQDEKFVYKYDGQVWEPNNYENKFYGQIPLFYALKNSINVATARLATDIGLEQIIGLSRRLGVRSEIQAVPSLSLGAYELSPLEVVESYSTIARFGRHQSLAFVKSISDLNDNLIYSHENNNQTVVRPENAAVLIGMLKQTLLSGTARSSQRLGFTRPAAGKTGTTSDTKDAWFAGFTPNTLSLVWVGYDDNTPTGLTGASGALPLWINFMKAITSTESPQDFIWPEGVTTYNLDSEKVRGLIPEPNTEELEGVQLILRKENAP